MTTETSPVIIGPNGLPIETQPQPAPTGTPEGSPPPEQVPAPTAPVTPAVLDVEPDVTPTFIQTGVSQIDDVAQLLATSKVEGKDAIIKNVLANGTLSLADQVAIQTALGEGTATLINNTLNSYTEAQKSAAAAETARIKDYANTKFNGTDSNLTWTQVQAFAKDNVPAEQRAEINTMLQAGGLSAQMAIDHIYSLYNGSSNAPAPNTQANLIQGQTVPAAGFQPLSKSDYAREVSAAVEQYGYDSHQVKSLQARRQASAANGY